MSLLLATLKYVACHAVMGEQVEGTFALTFDAGHMGVSVVVVAIPCLCIWLPTWGISSNGRARP